MEERTDMRLLWMILVVLAIVAFALAFYLGLHDYPLANR